MRWSDERKDTRCVHKKKDTSRSQNGSVCRGTVPYPAFTLGNGGTRNGTCGRYYQYGKPLFKISAVELSA